MGLFWALPKGKRPGRVRTTRRGSTSEGNAEPDARCKSKASTVTGWGEGGGSAIICDPVSKLQRKLAENSKGWIHGTSNLGCALLGRWYTPEQAKCAVSPVVPCYSRSLCKQLVMSSILGVVDFRVIRHDPHLSQTAANVDKNTVRKAPSIRK